MWNYRSSCISGNRNHFNLSNVQRIANFLFIDWRLPGEFEDWKKEALRLIALFLRRIIEIRNSEVFTVCNYYLAANCITGHIYSQSRGQPWFIQTKTCTAVEWNWRIYWQRERSTKTSRSGRRREKKMLISEEGESDDVEEEKGDLPRANCQWQSFCRQIAARQSFARRWRPFYPLSFPAIIKYAMGNYNKF